MVLNPVSKTEGSKVKGLGDLASELGSEAEFIRDNEGEAANHGIYFDDSEYDYMQHLRDLNTGAGNVVFVEATSASNQGKGKQKQSLEDALQQMDLEQTSNHLLDEAVLPSKNLQHLTYQAQQNIPDSIAGLQPDMDPSLREVLEALDDEAFVDDDEDVFNKLTEDGEELDDDEFQEQYDDFYDDDDGWESDATAKPTKENRDANDIPQLVGVTSGEADGVSPSDGWLEDFEKFKKDQKSGRSAPGARSEMQSSAWTATTNGGRRKKRKGALTNASSYSMSSSSLVRTEQMTLLDARFDKLDEQYQADFDDMGSVSEISSAYSVNQGPMPSGFDAIMDEFLEGFSKPGKRTRKNAKVQTGLEQLEEIRKGLGPPRLRTKPGVSQ